MTTKHRAPSALLLAAALSLPLALPSTAPAQDGGAKAGDAAEAESLPTAETVVDKMIEAVGGRAALEKVSSRRSKGKFEIPAQNMTATYVELNDGKGRYRLDMELPGFGQMSQGVAGEVVWSLNPFQGASIQEGAEADMQKRAAKLWPILHTKTDYKTLATTGRETVDGKSCVIVEATDEHDNTEKWYVDENTWLRVKTTATVEAQMVGKITMTTTESDYREVDGILVAHRTLIDQGFQKISILVEELTFNAEITAESLSVPGEVKKLIEKQKEREKAQPPAEEGAEGGSMGSGG